MNTYRYAIVLLAFCLASFSACADDGRSTRKKADDIKAKTGTRMRAKINRDTANEGNRFYYEIFKGSEQNLQTLANIRARLVSIPLQVPLEKFSRDEQLAYWLNLYNITILGEIANKYPSVDLKAHWLIGEIPAGCTFGQPLQPGGDGAPQRT